MGSYICCFSRHKRANYFQDDIVHAMLTAHVRIVENGLSCPPPLWIVFSGDQDTARRNGIKLLSECRQNFGLGESVYLPIFVQLEHFEQRKLFEERGHGERAGVAFILSVKDTGNLKAWLCDKVAGSGMSKPLRGLSFALYCTNQDEEDVGLFEFDALVLSLGGDVLVAPGDEKVLFSYWAAAMNTKLAKGGEKPDVEGSMGDVTVVSPLHAQPTQV